MSGAALVLLLAATAALSPPARESAARPGPALDTDAEQEAFLAEASVVRTRSAGGGGVTGARRATLRLGELQHDALIQTIDEERPYANLGRGAELDFRDSYRNNVAAYRLDRLLGLRMVPVSVVRHHDSKRSGFTWWVDDVKMDERTRLKQKVRVPDVERWNREMWAVRVFDQLIYNTDRNLGNLLIDKKWRIWMIDHTRAFKVFDELKSASNLETHCPRSLLEAMRRLDEETLKSSMRDLLSDIQIRGLLGRRDRIVKHFEEQIAMLGEAEVLYELPSRELELVSPAP